MAESLVQWLCRTWAAAEDAEGWTPEELVMAERLRRAADDLAAALRGLEERPRG